METEYNSYRLGLTNKRAVWLVNWLWEVVTTGSVMARDMSHKLGRLGFAAIALDWERPFLGPLYAWSSAIQGKAGPMKLPVMLRVLMSWLASRLDGGERLQRPDVGVPWSSIRMLNCLEIFAGCQGPWFSLEVEKGWAPWAFVKGDTKKVIAALELLATLIGVRLWVLEGQTKQTSRVAIKGYTDNQSNESLLKKFMTWKFPSTLILMELAEELTAKRCELKLHWLRRDKNQLADDLTNEKFDSFDKEFRVPLEGADIQWRILDLTQSAEGFYQELRARKDEGRAEPHRFKKLASSKKRKLAPW